MIYFYSSPCNLTGVRACRALNSLGSLTDCTHPPSTLCLLGEGVSWIWSRRAGKQRSKGSEVFQLSPAFFSPLTDGSQMFLKQTLSLYLFSSYPLSPYPSTHVFSWLLPFSVFLSSGVAPLTKVLASPCLIVIALRQINAPSPHLFSYSVSLLFPTPAFPSFASSPPSHLSSLIIWSDWGQRRTVSPTMYLTFSCFCCVWPQIQPPSPSNALHMWKLCDCNALQA